MAIDLTEVKANINNIKNDLFFEDEGNNFCEFIVDNKVALRLEAGDGWYMPKRPTTNLALGAEYFEFSVISSSANLGEIVPLMSELRIRGVSYSIVGYFIPKEATKEFKIRLKTLGSI